MAAALLLLTEDGFCPGPSTLLYLAKRGLNLWALLGEAAAAGRTVSIPGCQYLQSPCIRALPELRKGPQWVSLDLGLLPPILGKSYS